MGKKSIRAIPFILRCSGAATVGYELPSALGLHEALCDAMSAVIVSEEDLHETRSSLLGRIFGTLLGIGITVEVSEVASRLAASTTLQMVVAVGISALIVRWRASSLIQFAWYPRSASNIIFGSNALRRIEHSRLSCASPGVRARCTGRPLVSTTA